MIWSLAYNNTLLSALDRHAPAVTKTITKRPTFPWFNQQVSRKTWEVFAQSSEPEVHVKLKLQNKINSQTACRLVPLVEMVKVVIDLQTIRKLHVTAIFVSS